MHKKEQQLGPPFMEVYNYARPIVATIYLTDLAEIWHVV